MRTSVSIRPLLIVFLVSLAVRGLVLLAVHHHPEGIFQPDSRMYLGLAQGLRQHGTLCYPDSPELPDTGRMPAYPLFLAGVLALGGGSAFLIVVVQAFLDALSCCLVFVLAEKTLGHPGGWLCGLLAAVNVNMITYACFVLNDSLFLLAFLFWILMFIHWLETPRNGWSLGIGLILAATAMIRPVMLYFPLFLMPYAVVYLAIRMRKGLLRAVGGGLLIGAAFLAGLCPWLARNDVHTGHAGLTSQAGEHLLEYVVPFVWQYSRGIPFIEGMKEANRRTKERVRELGVDWEAAGPFEKSDMKVRMAVEHLREAPKTAIAKAWAFGMVKNLFAPAVIDFSYVLGVERPHFFYTKGRTLLERGIHFIKGIQGWFGWVVIGSLVSMALVRLVQLWGIVLLLRHKFWEGLFFAGVVSYFLLVSGPVGYAKYRLPFEPVLILFLGGGLLSIGRRVLPVPSGRTPEKDMAAVDLKPNRGYPL